MDVAAESAYPTPLSTSPMLPLLLLSLATHKHAPDGATSIKAEYDYIIVGAGSAGSVLASRLSEVPCVSVLLLEAGKRPPLLTEVPSMFFTGTDIDWKYRTAPQKHTGFGMINREIPMPMGKALGGTSTLNVMLHVRGNRKNYDDWAAQGAEGWSYEEVMPYFIKMEDNKDIEFLANGYHGIGGPVTIHKPKYEKESKPLILEAGRLLGYDVVDSNSANQTGFYDHQSTLRDSQRCSTAKAYLVPAENRENLDILPNAMVRRIVIEDRRATGVLFDIQGRPYEVRARKEVILSAGAVNSPQLLMLSGIGPKSELQKHNIPVIADLPVGRNLQDHAGPAMSFTINPTVSLAERNLSSPINIARYIQYRTGPLASTVNISGVAFLNNHTKRYPNYLLCFLEKSGDGLKKLRLEPEVYQQVYAPYENDIVLICTTASLEPKSRGRITLRSTDPYDPPIIDPNYYDDRRDLEDVIEGLHMCKSIGMSEPLRRIGARPLRTLFPGCERYAGNDDQYFHCQAKKHISTFQHLCGTVKMGSPLDPTAVLDPQLRVKGIRGLRVVDASIMPTVTSGHTNSPTIMIAEKASDIVKSEMECAGTPPAVPELLNLKELPKYGKTVEEPAKPATPTLWLGGKYMHVIPPWSQPIRSRWSWASRYKNILYQQPQRSFWPYFANPFTHLNYIASPFLRLVNQPWVNPAQYLWWW